MNKPPTAQNIRSFRKTVYAYFENHGRTLPWRKTDDPFHIFISEVMLQQTQVDRVAKLFDNFVERYSTPRKLAEASVRNVLQAWQGLGYNRRALMLQKAAQQIEKEWSGVVPSQVEQLVTLPGIGPATARSVAAFAFNEPTVFVETNIRSVFIHHFFPDETAVTDAVLLPLVEKTLDRSAPSRWYSALMDYGSDLKKRTANPSRRSAHHVRQSKFEGSDRRIRGAVIRALLENEEGLGRAALGRRVECADSVRLDKILTGLAREGFICRAKRRWTAV